MRLETAAEVAVAVVLHELLRDVQVDAERVGPDRRDELRHPLDAGLARLDGPDVPEQQRVGRSVAHPVAVDLLRVAPHGALRADAERQAALLGARSRGRG